MGRKKKDTGIVAIEEGVKSPECVDMGEIRDHKGLVRNLQYYFNTLGFVDWEKMIDPEFIVLNRENFLKKENPIDIDTLSDDELNELKRKSKSKDRLILLAGLKELARLRGYDSFYTRVETTPNGAVATCNIEWIGNFETGGKYVSSCGVADATLENTEGLATKYLAAIAENRAFSRAVRNFLMIHTVSDAETKFNTSEYEVKPEVLKSGPQFSIFKKLKDAKKSFNEFQQWVMTNDLAVGAEVWEKESDIPSDQAVSLLAKIGDFLK